MEAIQMVEGGFPIDFSARRPRFRTSRLRPEQSGGGARRQAALSEIVSRRHPAGQR